MNNTDYFITAALVRACIRQQANVQLTKFMCCKQNGKAYGVSGFYKDQIVMVRRLGQGI